MDWKQLIPWRKGNKRIESSVATPPRASLRSRPLGPLGPLVPSTTALEDVDIMDFGSAWLSSRHELGSAIHSEGNWLAAADVRSDESKVTVRVDLPGLAVEDIDLSLSPAGDALILRGERYSEGMRDSEDGGGATIERYHGLIQRSIDLPCEVSLEDVSAQLREGVLQVELKRRRDYSTGLRIEVKAG